MAKSKKPGTKAVEQPEAKEPKARPAISQNKLKTLMAAARSTNKEVAELTGTLAQKIAVAVENDHLHKKAFGVIRMLDKMEPEKLADFLDCFDHYLDISGLEKRAESVARMDFGPGEEASEASAEPKPRENVRAFPAPRSVAAE